MSARSLIIFSNYDGNQVAVWADSASDIPDAKSGWVAGSIAFSIDTGIFYVLNSEGNWVNQEDFTELGAETVSTPSASPTVLTANKDLLKSETVVLENANDLQECVSQNEEIPEDA